MRARVQLDVRRIPSPAWRPALRQLFERVPPLDEIVYTRVAGVSCAVLPEHGELEAGERRYRVWVDYSYARDLWDSLFEVLNTL